MKARKVISCMLIAAFMMSIAFAGMAIAANAGSVAPYGAVNTSYDVKPLTNIAQPAKGQSFTDPAYGNVQVIRLTDRSDDPAPGNPGCIVPYSYWSVFNNNSTKYFIASTNGALRLYNFDPNTYTSTYVGPLTTGLDWQGLIWSHDDPNVLYGLKGYYAGLNNQLCSYNVATGQLTVVHDFTASGDLPMGNPLQMNKAAGNDRYFTFYWKASDNAENKYAVVYDAVLNKTYKFDATDPAKQVSNFDECKLSRTGTECAIITGKEMHLWDFVNNTQQIAQYNSTEQAGGHYELGDNFMVHVNIWANSNGNRTIERPLSDITKWTQMFDSGQFANPPYSVSDWSTDHHYSLEGPNDSWLCVSAQTFSGTTVTKPFQNEIFLAKTDGSGQVIRLANARCSTSSGDYWRTPFAQLSPDGRFVAFNSDWNNPNQPEDVYIIPLDQSIWGNSSTLPTPTTAPAPTPTPTPGSTSDGAGVYNDTNTGAGTNQIQYVGTWNYKTYTSGPYQLDLHENKNTNNTDYAKISFYGTGIKVYTLTDTWNGKCAVSVDGGSETTVDTYGPSQWQTLLFGTANLPLGNHTITIRATGTMNAAAQDKCLFIDSYEVLNTGAPVVTPAPDPVTSLVTVNDSTTGTGNNQFEYGPSQWDWVYTNASWAATAYQSDLTGSAGTNAYANVRFNGTQIQLYGVKGSWLGNVALSIDSGSETIVSCYAPGVDQIGALLYTSPSLAAGQHMLTIRATGTRDASSTGAGIYLDSVVINTGSASATTPAPTPTPTPTPAPAPVTVNDSTTGTGNNQFSFGPDQWAWNYTSASWTSAAYQGDLTGTSLTNAYATIKFAGTQIKLYGAKGGWFGKAAVSIDAGPETIIDCYASGADQVQSLLYSSSTLAAGSHTLTIRVTGTCNASSSSNWIYVDSAVIQP